MRDAEFRLLDEFQRAFPLCPRPYAIVGGRLGLTETEVIVTLARLAARGCVSRVGATLVPGRVGAATLAALAVPRERLETVAALVSGYREVNHNYEREHDPNLWFVVTAPRGEHVERVLRDIERRADCGRILALPMTEAYRLDLGFGLGAREGAHGHARASLVRPEPYPLEPAERAVLAALEAGLPFSARPYAEIGRKADMNEAAVIATLRRLLREQVIGRFGVIVRHRALGYRANAMSVWDVPDHEVRDAGLALARDAVVTLCYRRRREPARWPYNLYCMIHGTHRGTVEAHIERLTGQCGLGRHPRAVLFSRRCFKQRGARYLEEDAHGRDRPPDREPAAERIPRHRAALP